MKMNKAENRWNEGLLSFQMFVIHWLHFSPPNFPHLYDFAVCVFIKNVYNYFHSDIGI